MVKAMSVTHLFSHLFLSNKVSSVHDQIVRYSLKQSMMAIRDDYNGHSSDDDKRYKQSDRSYVKSYDQDESIRSVSAPITILASMLPVRQSLMTIFLVQVL